MKISLSHREMNKEPTIHCFDINENKIKTIDDNKENIEINGNNNFIIFSKPSSLVKGIEIKDIKEVKKEKDKEKEKEKENENEKEIVNEKDIEKRKETIENNLIKLQKIEKIIEKRTHSLSPSVQKPINSNIINYNKQNNNINSKNNVNTKNNHIINNNNSNNNNKKNQSSKLRTLSPQSSKFTTIKTDNKKIKQKKNKISKRYFWKIFSFK